MQKKSTAVIFGGCSSEYEVSLQSAFSILENLNTEKYDIIPIGITREGDWYRYRGEYVKLLSNTWAENPAELTGVTVSHNRSTRGIIENGSTVTKVDFAFPVLHGKNGEDGTMQGLLELAGIPYVGCDVLSSAVCMDKAITNTLLDSFGIPHAPWRQMVAEQLPEFDSIAEEWENALEYPIFVKPANAGSSVGISKAHDRKELRAAVELALQHDRKIVAERCIVGREIECAVIGNLHPVASEVSEIIPRNEFYDYEAKYVAASETVLPADLTPELRERVQRGAEKAFAALGCSGISRVDFLYETATDTLFLNEPNTLPGFTSISMYPKMMAASGTPYPELIAKLIELALEKHGR